MCSRGYTCTDWCASLAKVFPWSLFWILSGLWATVYLLVCFSLFSMETGVLSHGSLADFFCSVSPLPLLLLTCDLWDFETSVDSRCSTDSADSAFISCRYWSSALSISPFPSSNLLPPNSPEKEIRLQVSLEELNSLFLGMSVLLNFLSCRCLLSIFSSSSSMYIVYFMFHSRYYFPKIILFAFVAPCFMQTWWFFSWCLICVWES